MQTVVVRIHPPQPLPKFATLPANAIKCTTEAEDGVHLKWRDTFDILKTENDIPKFLK
jgi:hypothetical protein